MSQYVADSLTKIIFAVGFQMDHDKIPLGPASNISYGTVFSQRGYEPDSDESSGNITTKRYLPSHIGFSERDYEADSDESNGRNVARSTHLPPDASQHGNQQDHDFLSFPSTSHAPPQLRKSPRRLINFERNVLASMFVPPAHLTTKGEKYTRHKPSRFPAEREGYTSRPSFHFAKEGERTTTWFPKDTYTAKDFLPKGRRRPSAHFAKEGGQITMWIPSEIQLQKQFPVRPIPKKSRDDFSIASTSVQRNPPGENPSGENTPGEDPPGENRGRSLLRQPVHKKTLPRRSASVQPIFGEISMDDFQSTQYRQNKRFIPGFEKNANKKYTVDPRYYPELGNQQDFSIVPVESSSTFKLKVQPGTLDSNRPLPGEPVSRKHVLQFKIQSTVDDCSQPLPAVPVKNKPTLQNKNPQEIPDLSQPPPAVQPLPAVPLLERRRLQDKDVQRIIGPSRSHLAVPISHGRMVQVEVFTIAACDSHVYFMKGLCNKKRDKSKIHPSVSYSQKKGMYELTSTNDKNRAYHVYVKMEGLDPVKIDGRSPNLIVENENHEVVPYKAPRMQRYKDTRFTIPVEDTEIIIE